MNFNFKQLQAYLDETILPDIKEKPITYQDIVKMPHYENVSSKIYSFFFQIDAKHNLGDLFISSLKQIINIKVARSLNFSSVLFPETEFKTKKGRIDILLYNEKEAVIIENKIFHYLNNDLDDYWDSITQENKVGVVLSIKKIDVRNVNFINITHLEFLDSVFKNLSKYLANADEKYLVFLRDFYQNILNLTNPMSKELVHFFNVNGAEINHISLLRDQYIQYIITEVELSCEMIDEKLALYGNRNNRFRYFLCPSESNLMITIVFDSLYDGRREIYFIVELQNDLLDRRQEIKEIKFNLSESNLINSGFYSDTESYSHLAVEVHKVSENEILELSSFISKKINHSPILSIYQKVKSVIER